MRKFIIIFIAGCLVSCASKKEKTATVDSKSDKEMIEAGYTKATITAFDAEPPCDFLIILDSGDQMEALSIPPQYKVDKTKLWIKYTPQRRTSRCVGSTPIIFNEILRVE